MPVLSSVKGSSVRSPHDRYPAVDLARLLAMCTMAVYHLAFDLEYFYGWDIDLGHPAWRAAQRGTLILFLMVSGVSAALSWKRSPSSWKFARRALTLLTWAMVITVTTYILDPLTSIRFGVLHCIAVATFLLPLLLPFGLWNAPLGIAIILIGYPFPFPPPFQTLDYVPLFPWMGVILLGSALGHFLPMRGWRPARAIPQWLRTSSVLGRYSLAFYLMHQPAILVILMIVLGRPNTL